MVIIFLAKPKIEPFPIWTNKYPSKWRHVDHFFLKAKKNALEQFFVEKGKGRFVTNVLYNALEPNAKLELNYMVSES